MIVRTYEQFRKGQVYDKVEKPYVIEVKYEHGDADFTTTKEFSFDNEDKMREIIKVLFKAMNFIPKQGYGKLGHYSPITENDGGRVKMRDIVDYKYIDYGYIQGDRRYDQGYASIEGIAVEIKGEPYILLDKDAAETNIIDLPSPGDVVNIDVNYICGHGKLFDPTKKYLPNSGEKDYIVKNFDSKVVDALINEGDYMKWGITSFPYILLFETDQKVLKSGADIYQSTSMRYQGWDKNFGQKFNKDEFDNLRIYVV